MVLEKSPVFRRTLIPWYDATPVCLILIMVMMAVFLFGLVGIAVSLEDERVPGSVWIPAFLVGLSGMVLLSVSARLVRRHVKSPPG